jgi:hypothetical protein
VTGADRIFLPVAASFASFSFRKENEETEIKLEEQYHLLHAFASNST